jgi:hypothetical protein
MTQVPRRNFPIIAAKPLEATIRRPNLFHAELVIE